MSLGEGRSSGAGLALLGAGHAHLVVLRELAARPLDGTSTVLVSPEREALYSGMVPAVVAGRIPRSRATIDLAGLAARAGVERLEARGTEVDPDGRRVRTSLERDLAWDACSIDVGSSPPAPAGLDDDLRVIPVRPFARLVERVSEFASLAEFGAVEPTAAVVGAGAAGIELAFAVRARLRGVVGARVLLLERGPRVLPSGSPAARRLVTHELARSGVEVTTGVGTIEFRAPALLASDRMVAAPSLVLLATGSTGPGFLARSPLARDDAGYLLVDRFLRSTSHPLVHGAGDCASLVGRPSLPRSGVRAVRQGAVLANNLRVAIGGLAAEMREWRPPRAELALVSTGDGRAIALRGRLAASGRAWGWLKQRIDGAWVESFRDPAARAADGPVG
ncbi:MAG: FAD-dependent oxidoreductase [Alphaproteobacteria bacterium]